MFAEKEFSDYFMRLPSEPRISLAAEIGYLTSEKTPGMMGQVRLLLAACYLLRVSMAAYGKYYRC